MNDRLPRSEALKLDAFFEVSNKLRRQVREHRHSAKVILERAAAVGLVELRAKRLVLKHDVQNVAQHLVGNNVGLRDDRGGPRIEIHARHFAEQITRTEFGDGVAVGEVHGSVNRNGAVASFFFALIFFALAAAFLIPGVVAMLMPVFWFVAKTGVLLFVFIWIRGTLPRFRYDQLMGFAWKFLFPVAVLNLLVTGLLVALFS